MRILLLLAVLSSIISCNNSSNDKIMSSKSARESTVKDIVGIWELLKQSYRPSDEPSLVEARYKEYLEIKPDGTCQEGLYPAKWFLSYTDDFVIDSTSKVLFSEMTYVTPNSNNEFDRTIKSYQIKVISENGKKYLYLTSLISSATKIYIQKN